MSTAEVRLILSICFFAGSCINWLIRAGFAYRSNVNPFPTRWSYVSRNWDVMAARFFFGFIAFWIWMVYPDGIPKVVAYFGIPTWLAYWLTITPNPASAAIGGAVSDVILDSAQSILATKNIPWLSKLIRAKVPQYDETVVDVKTVQARDKRDSE